MTFTTLDIIVRGMLLKKKYPIHWYMEYLTYAASCLRELNIDTLKVVNIVQLCTDDNGSVDVPDDFADDVALSLPNSRLKTLPHQNNISPIRNHNILTGAYQPSTNSANQLNLSYPVGFGVGVYYNTNDYFENTGRIFGGVGKSQKGYTVIKEQRRIQMSNGFANTGVVLVYVSDGQSVDSASQIDIKAITTIEGYILWCESPNFGILGTIQANSFYRLKKNLKARLSDIETTEDLLNVIRGTYKASLKG
jgi:hypothetical protein